MTVRLLLFGSPTVEFGGESVALPFERRGQLLVFLALKRSWVGRAELAGMLWPELSSKLAYANLRKILFRLQTLPWAPTIDAQGGVLRFEAETDVSAFESALRDNRVADALSLRRDELLRGFDDDPNEAWSSWLSFERDRLRVAWRGAALDRLAAEIDPGEGIELSARLLDADPLDEAALRAHMSWLGRNGQGARARQAYREFAGRLEQDLGLAPGAELKALHDSLAVTIAPPITEVATAPRAPADGFVGRTVELRRMAALLGQGDCRLLTLVGPGGVGKTRLAQRAIRDLAPGYADGAAFVPLEDIAAANDVGGRLARELDVRLVGRREPLDQVVEFLRGRHMLLVLDNFEQLAAAATMLKEMLDACARLHLVVTSRVRLALPMEWVLPLEGLPCPEIEDQDRAEAFDAVRLFIQTAQRVEPALVPAVESASIVDICRQVQGLPLALELAAAWTRVLSCDAIAAELRLGTGLLHAVDAAHPARHASIDVVFDQSWRLLGASERDALSRLSVFRGGFSAEAARAIAAASLPVLGALADKSLLQKDDARLSLHPLLQQLAGMRLDDGARESTQRAHAGYFLRLLSQLRRAVEDGEREALQAVDTEFENCRMAWRWAAAHAATDALGKSVPTLLNFCDHRGRFEEGLALLRETLESQLAQATPKLASLLLASAAHLEYRLDRYDDAQATAARALAATRSTRDHDARLQCFKVLGACCLRRGRYVDARRYFKQALQQAPENVDPHNAAAMLDNLALVEKAMGDYGEALRLSLQSLVQHRRLGDVADEAMCLNNLGAMYLDREDYESGGAYLREGLVLCDRHGLVSTRGLILANLAEFAAKTGDDNLAGTHGRRALDVAETTGNRGLVCWLKLLFAQLALRRGDLAAVRAELAAALEIAIVIGRPALLVSGVTCFADLLAAQGETDCARRTLALAAGHPSTSDAQRAENRARLAQLPPATSTESTGAAIELDELVHRIVVESDIAHAPLIAALRGGR